MDEYACYRCRIEFFTDTAGWDKAEITSALSPCRPRFLRPHPRPNHRIP